jgi:hypothetical protein
LTEEHRLRVIENSVLRRVFGPKKDGVMGEWRKLHRRMRWMGHVAHMGERRGAYRVLVWKPVEKSPLGSSGSVMVGGEGGIDWIDLAQDRYRRWALVEVVMDIRVP